ncbi:hypothetical protein HK102_004820 [Quaeritorhiza haematococci]|nr:hypothetical protein HK102_004820 [Quaeritorhiza haematococci]
MSGCTIATIATQSQLASNSFRRPLRLDDTRRKEALWGVSECLYYQVAFAPAPENTNAPPVYDECTEGSSCLGGTSRRQEKGKENDDEAKKVLKKGGVRHYLSIDDTVSGLALKYGVNASTIRRANNIYSDDSLCARSWVFIPEAAKSFRPERGPEDETKALVKRFQLMSKCTDLWEAWSYMRQNDFDIDKAIVQYVEDVEWEKTHP